MEMHENEGYAVEETQADSTEQSEVVVEHYEAPKVEVHRVSKLELAALFPAVLILLTVAYSVVRTAVGLPVKERLTDVQPVYSSHIVLEELKPVQHEGTQPPPDDAYNVMLMQDITGAPYYAWTEDEWVEGRETHLYYATGGEVSYPEVHYADNERFCRTYEEYYISGVQGTWKWAKKRFPCPYDLWVEIESGSDVLITYNAKTREILGIQPYSAETEG